MRDIGAYIKQLRTERGMTQSELGKIIGVQKAAVQKWENGTVRNLKRKTVLKLSEYFGVAPATFRNRRFLRYRIYIPTVFTVFPFSRAFPRASALTRIPK